MDEEHEARKALEEGQFQIDDDGHTIGVSRQALCETLGAYDTMRQSLATKTQEVTDLTERVEKMKEEIGQAMDEYDMGAEATARARLDRLTATPSPKCPECERKP